MAENVFPTPPLPKPYIFTTLFTKMERSLTSRSSRSDKVNSWTWTRTTTQGEGGLRSRGSYCAASNRSFPSTGRRGSARFVVVRHCQTCTRCDGKNSLLADALALFVGKEHRDVLVENVVGYTLNSFPKKHAG